MPNLNFGGIPKDTKKPANSQNFVYELVGWFYIIYWMSQIIDFTDKDGNDTMQQQIDANYYLIKNEVKQIVADEIERIKADPELSYLIKEK